MSPLITTDNLNLIISVGGAVASAAVTLYLTGINNRRDKKQQAVLNLQAEDRAYIDSDLYFIKSFLYQVEQTPFPTDEVLDDSFIQENIIQEIHSEWNKQRFREIHYHGYRYIEEDTQNKIQEMSILFERILRDSSQDMTNIDKQTFEDADTFKSCLEELMALMDRERKTRVDMVKYGESRKSRRE